MSESGYSFKPRNVIDNAVVGDDKHVTVYEFEGPGMPQHANTVVVWRAYDAESLARLLTQAFRAGEAKAREDMRHALGIADTPWGLKLR